MNVRSFEREFTDGDGAVVRVRVEIDDGPRLEREILRLANKARSSRTRRCATSAGGVLRVCVLPTVETTTKSQQKKETR